MRHEHINRNVIDPITMEPIHTIIDIPHRVYTRTPNPHRHPNVQHHYNVVALAELVHRKLHGPVNVYGRGPAQFPLNKAIIDSSMAENIIAQAKKTGWKPENIEYGPNQSYISASPSTSRRSSSRSRSASPEHQQQHSPRRSPSRSRSATPNIPASPTTSLQSLSRSPVYSSSRSLSPMNSSARSLSPVYSSNASIPNSSREQSLPVYTPTSPIRSINRQRYNH